MNSQGLFNEQLNKCGTVGYILWIYSKQSRDAVKLVWCQLSKKKMEIGLKKVESSRKSDDCGIPANSLGCSPAPSSANAFYGVKFKSSGATLS